MTTDPRQHLTPLASPGPTDQHNLVQGESKGSHPPSDSVQSSVTDDTLADGDAGTDTIFDSSEDDSRHSEINSAALEIASRALSSLEDVKTLIKDEFIRLHQRLDGTAESDADSPKTIGGPQHPSHASDVGELSNRPTPVKSRTDSDTAPHLQDSDWQPASVLPPYTPTAAPEARVPSEAADLGKPPRTAKTDKTPVYADDYALFNSQGYPTPILESMLNCLANYLIEECAPQRTILVTPAKLSAFYSTHSIRQEVFPFTALFDSESKQDCERIADLFQDLGCEYHLVQRNAKSRPIIPALTSAGFTRWITTNMLAHPNEEGERLGRLFSALPFLAEYLDGDAQLLSSSPSSSRHLLPAQADTKSRRHMEEALRDFLEDTCMAEPEPDTRRYSDTRRGESGPRDYAPISTTAEYALAGSSGAQPSRRHHSDVIGMAAHSQVYLPPPPVGQYDPRVRTGRSPGPASRFTRSVSDVSSASTLSAPRFMPPSTSQASNLGVDNLGERNRQPVRNAWPPLGRRVSTSRSATRPLDPIDGEDPPRLPERPLQRRSLVMSSAGPTWNEHLSRRGSVYSPTLSRDPTYQSPRSP